MECKLYIKNEDILENTDIFVYGIKQIKADKVNIYILIGCESDELNQNDKIFNFWSNKFINEEIKKRSFKLTGRSFMTLAKRNSFFKLQSLVCI